MLPIRAQLCTEELKSCDQLDHGRRWVTAGDGSRPDMDRRPEVDNLRWITGDGGREMDHGRRMTINLLPYMKLPSYNQARVCRHTVFQRHSSTQYNAKQYSEQYSKHCSEIGIHAPTFPSADDEYNPESDPESQLQPRDRTSVMRIIFGGGTITKERDDSAGIATTPTTNYLTGSAGTKHCETHSQKEPSNGEMSTQRSDGVYISRRFKKPHG